MTEIDLDLATVQRFRLAPDWAGFCRCVKMNQFHFDSVQIRVEYPDTWHRTVSSVLIWFLRSPAWWSRFFCVCVAASVEHVPYGKAWFNYGVLTENGHVHSFYSGPGKGFLFFYFCWRAGILWVKAPCDSTEEKQFWNFVIDNRPQPVYQTRIIIPCFNWMMKDKARALFRQTIRRAVNEDGLSEQNHQQ